MATAQRTGRLAGRLCYCQPCITLLLHQIVSEIQLNVGYSYAFDASPCAVTMFTGHRTRCYKGVVLISVRKWFVIQVAPGPVPGEHRDSAWAGVKRITVADVQLNL